MLHPHELRTALFDRRSVLVGLTLLLGFIVIAYRAYEPYTFLHEDGTFYANINKAIARDGSIEQTQYHPRSWLVEDLGWNRNLDQGWSNVSLGRDGRWMPKHSFVLPLFSTPLFVVFGYDGLLWFHMLALVVGLMAAFEVARTYLSDGVAALATMAVAAQPVVSGDVYSYNNDVFYSALLLVGVVAQLRQRPWLAGLVYGLAVWAKATNVLFIAPVGLALLWGQPWSTWRRMAMAFAVPMSLFLAANTWFYGAPWVTSYSRILMRKDGQLATESIRERFKEPFKTHVKTVLEDEREGVIPRAPLLALGLVGAGVLAVRRRRSLGLGAAFWVATATFVALHGKYHYVYARFFLPVVLLSVLPLGGLLDALSRLRPFREREGWTTAGAWSLGGLVVVLALLWARTHRPPSAGWRASDHVEDAVVSRDSKRCDYFNNQRQKWECPGDGPHDFFWGASLGKQCTFDGQPRSMLWLHPTPGTREKRMRFEGLPAGTATVTLGLDDTSRERDVTLELGLVDGPRWPIEGALGPNERKTVVLSPEESGLTEPGKALEIVVRGSPVHWRHLCVEVEVLP